jgi:hypothetical protein
MDAVLEAMREYNVPLTLKNYLEMAYPDQEPDLDAELLSMIPEEVMAELEDES